MKKLSRKTILPTGPALAAAALAACLALCGFIGHAGAQTAGRVEYQELSWSPDGKKISFTANRDKNWDIYVMNADGSNLVRLTDDPAGDLYASWSPDGRSLAFASKREGKYAIYVTGADGKNPRRVIATADNTYPSWSPDGRSLAFMSNRTGKWQIYVAKADGSGERRVTSSQGNDYNPAWSPDGKKLAFESDRDGGDIDEIYVVDASGKNERRITKNNEKKVNDVFPTWISKKRISYTTVANRRVDVQVMTSDGLNPTLLIEHAFFARWSPDRSKIAFISQATGESPSQIYLMSADGKSRTQLTR